ncbi:ATP:cob(I)alamin adenosyltransferase [Patescibacteria group bacterium]|nr:ATP:cob(I)alamin adenosyltransferase [Patescibacteria group bacterium]
MNKIHHGDSGSTRDYTGKQYSKDDLPIQTLGEIDELIAYLGLIRYILKSTPESKFIFKIQEQLKSFSAQIAQYNNVTHHVSLENLESKINDINSKYPPIKDFYIPGDKEIPTFLNIVRTVCRRAERSIVRLKPQDKTIIPFLNRLSTYIFSLQMYYMHKK